MTYETLLVTTPAPGVRLVTINRPAQLNALSPVVLRELLQAIADAAGDAATRALLLTGAGEKAFVAGADIAAMRAMSALEGREFAVQGHALMRTIEMSPFPVIALVNGFALGGGCELALACDFIVASEKAVFGQPEVNLGIVPGFGGTQRLTRLVGKGMAVELCTTGRQVKADEALRIGLANHVVAPGRAAREGAGARRPDRAEGAGGGQAREAPDPARPGHGPRQRQRVRGRRVRRGVRHRRPAGRHGRLPREAQARVQGALAHSMQEASAVPADAWALAAILTA